MSIKKFRKILKNNKGFSLIELIVVIAILGVLAGVAAPNVIRYVNNARVNADIANGALIANALQGAIAEGFTLAPAADDTDGTKAVSTDSAVLTGTILTAPDATATELVPTFLQTMPTPQEDGFDAFRYTYTSTGTLTVYKANTANDNGVQLYPRP
ncbi:type II secretion system protein [Petroclostridium sp. X23]|uniref:type II secretion system protein n=1 Tax=Petroclostridium sp. X23 TaxID=3045146 RepID=UPI0024AE818F|nr:type II secretion system protein [Petroclostridium sp. X23]WHH59665.1 type II secretion system protein [Petroclostridium sp. X23]